MIGKGLFFDVVEILNWYCNLAFGAETNNTQVKLDTIYDIIVWTHHTLVQVKDICLFSKM